jgi:hypothetical protein
LQDGHLKAYRIYLNFQKWLETNCRKNYKDHLRSNNNEVCTAVAHCFLNILDDMALEIVNLSSDKIGRPSLWSNFLLSVTYICCQWCIFQPHVNFKCTLDLEVFNFSEKITYFTFYLMLWFEFITCQFTNFKSRSLDLFCNYLGIVLSSVFVVILQYL